MEIKKVLALLQGIDEISREDLREIDSSLTTPDNSLTAKEVVPLFSALCEKISNSSDLKTRQRLVRILKAFLKTLSQKKKLVAKNQFKPMVSALFEAYSKTQNPELEQSLDQLLSLFPAQLLPWQIENTASSSLTFAQFRQAPTLLSMLTNQKRLTPCKVPAPIPRLLLEAPTLFVTLLGSGALTVSDETAWQLLQQVLKDSQIVADSTVRAELFSTLLQLYPDYYAKQFQHSPETPNLTHRLIEEPAMLKAFVKVQTTQGEFLIDFTRDLPSLYQEIDQLGPLPSQTQTFFHALLSYVTASFFSEKERSSCLGVVLAEFIRANFSIFPDSLANLLKLESREINLSIKLQDLLDTEIRFLSNRLLNPNQTDAGTLDGLPTLPVGHEYLSDAIGNLGKITDQLTSPAQQVVAISSLQILLKRIRATQVALAERGLAALKEEPENNSNSWNSLYSWLGLSEFPHPNATKQEKSDFVQVILDSFKSDLNVESIHSRKEFNDLLDEILSLHAHAILSVESQRNNSNQTSTAQLLSQALHSLIRQSNKQAQDRQPDPVQVVRYTQLIYIIEKASFVHLTPVLLQAVSLPNLSDARESVDCLLALKMPHSDTALLPRSGESYLKFLDKATLLPKTTTRIPDAAKELPKANSIPTQEQLQALRRSRFSTSSASPPKDLTVSPDAPSVLPEAPNRIPEVEQATTPPEGQNKPSDHVNWFQQLGKWLWSGFCRVGRLIKNAFLRLIGPSYNTTGAAAHASENFQTTPGTTRPDVANTLPSVSDSSPIPPSKP